MLVFLDTEFTDFARPELISLALVAEDGREFYAERTDYPAPECSAFVRETVLPLLGRVSGAACNSTELADRLRAWFAALPEPATIIFDYETDWHLLSVALGPGRPQMRLPANFGEPLHLLYHHFKHPIFEHAQLNAYIPDWPPHHALADARALMAGYRAWRPIMEKIWQIQ